MSRRKPPVTTKAQREAIPESFSDLREKMKECLAKIEQATRQTMQLTKSPASGWRSMASAPKDGSSFLGIAGKYSVVRIGYVCADGQHFRTENDSLFRLDEMHAWAPIPEWTGEVSE